MSIHILWWKVSIYFKTQGMHKRGTTILYKNVCFYSYKVFFFIKNYRQLKINLAFEQVP